MRPSDDSALRTRFLFADRVGPGESRRLMAWALEHGADEFTLDVMGLHETPAPHADAFEELLDPWQRPSARRRVLYHPPGRAHDDPQHRDVRLWRLTPISATLLGEFLERGIFHYDVQERGWLEDPIVYRGGELLFGAISHEREGVLRVTEDEEAELSRLGIPCASSGLATGF